MRIKLAVASGAALVLLAGTGAAYAVVGQTSESPTVTGNVLPIDDNHRTTAHPEPGDDRGRATTEPGDDRGGASRGRPRGATATSAPATTAAAGTTAEDHRGHDGSGHH